MTVKKIESDEPLELYVFDDEVPKSLQKEVYENMLDMEFHVNWYDSPASRYYPRTKEYDHSKKNPSVHRCPLAWDDESLSHRAPVVYKLWEHIRDNVLTKVSDTAFEIEGRAEGMPNYMRGISPRYGERGTDGIGWNVYFHGIENYNLKKPKAIHRDNHRPEKDGYYTLVYFANDEWYPSDFGETIFWGSDPERKTGDYTGRYESDQKRDFPIGPAVATVSPLPGRFMLYDSRFLHGTKPCHPRAKEMLYGLVFRISKVGIAQRDGNVASDLIPYEQSDFSNHEGV